RAVARNLNRVGTREIRGREPEPRRQAALDWGARTPVQDVAGRWVGLSAGRQAGDRNGVVVWIVQRERDLDRTSRIDTRNAPLRAEKIDVQCHDGTVLNPAVRPGHCDRVRPRWVLS